MNNWSFIIELYATSKTAHWNLNDINMLGDCCYMKILPYGFQWSSRNPNVVFVCMFSQESVRLESRCSTWAGTNITASSSTRATQVETTEAGKLLALETTALWVSLCCVFSLCSACVQRNQLEWHSLELITRQNPTIPLTSIKLHQISHTQISAP